VDSIREVAKQLGVEIATWHTYQTNAVNCKHLTCYFDPVADTRDGAGFCVDFDMRDESDQVPRSGRIRFVTALEAGAYIGRELRNSEKRFDFRVLYG
jgi:hypothetical protein